MRWLTFEDAHVDGFIDPPNCDRAADGVTLQSALTSGEVDAAIGLEPNPSWRPLLADVAGAEADWVRQTGVLPINHVLVVKEELAETYPWLPRELFELFASSFEGGGSGNPKGIEALRPGVELLGRFAVEQGIVARPPTTEELFDALS